MKNFNIKVYIIKKILALTEIFSKRSKHCIYKIQMVTLTQHNNFIKLTKFLNKMNRVVIYASVDIKLVFNWLN